MGNNKFGQLGIDDNNNHNIPTLLTLPNNEKIKLNLNWNKLNHKYSSNWNNQNNINFKFKIKKQKNQNILNLFFIHTKRNYDGNISIFRFIWNKKRIKKKEMKQI